jgi:cell division GTPase FtsZ
VTNTLNIKMPKIIAVGCGSEGNYAISLLFNSGVVGVKTIAIDTDKSRLDKVQANSKILIGNGYEKIASLENKMQIDEHSIQKLEEELKDVELLFVTSRMGGKILTEAIPVLTEIGRKQNGIVIGLVTIPSEKYPGGQKPTTDDMIELSKKDDIVAFVDHGRVHKLFPALPIDQISSFSGKLIAEMIGGIVDSLNPEILFLIKLDFTDLKAIMKNGGIGTLVFNEVEDDVEKEDKAKRLAHGLMQRSLMDVDANNTKNCLLIFTQGVDSNRHEIEQIVSCATYDFDCWANILWGSVETKDYYGKLRCMGIISGFSVAL